METTWATRCINIKDLKDKNLSGTITSHLSGPKWAGLKQLLYSLANRSNLTLLITDHDKGWLRETIYYKVIGKKFQLAEFKINLELSLQRYNE